MKDMPPLLTALAAVSLALTLWLLLHRVLVVLGWRRLRNGFCGGPEEVTGGRTLEIDGDLVDEVTALGFRPVGVYWERLALGGIFREAVFVSKAEKCYALLYPNNQIAPRRASFLTVTPDGRVVQTKNYPGGVVGAEDGFVAGPPEGLAEDDDYRAPLAEVLAEHRARLARVLRAGDKPVVGLDPEWFVELERQYHAHPFVRRQHRSAEIANLTAQVLLLGFVPGLLTLCVGVRHPAPWVCLLLECLIGLVLRYGTSSSQFIGLARSAVGDVPKPVIEQAVWNGSGGGGVHEVEFVLGEEDYTAWELCIHRQQWRFHCVVVGAAEVVLVSLLYWFGAAMSAEAFCAGVFHLGVGVVFLVSSPWWMPRRAAGLGKKAHARAAEEGTDAASISLRPEGLSLRTATGLTLQSWRSLGDIIVTDLHVLFHRSDRPIVCVPRRAFADDEAFAAFVEAAQAFRRDAQGATKTA